MCTITESYRLVQYSDHELRRMGSAHHAGMKGSKKSPHLVNDNLFEVTTTYSELQDKAQDTHAESLV